MCKHKKNNHFRSSKDTFIASSPLTVYDLLKSEACRNRHIYCSFSVEEMLINIDGLERDLRKLGVKSIGFQDGNVLILDKAK